MARPTSFDRRQTMLRPDYEIQHKLDTALEDVQLHHHDFYELIYLVSGDVTYSVESRVYRVMPGNVLLISPQELHSGRIRADMAPYERYVLWVAPAFAERLSTRRTNLMELFSGGTGRCRLLRLPLRLRKAVRDCMEAILQEFETDAAAYGAEMMAPALMMQLFVILGRVAKEQTGPEYEPEQEGSSAALVTSVTDYLNLHYNETLSLDRLAEQFFVSKYHLSHAFTQQVGTSVYRYVQKKRLQIARQLLAQGMQSSRVCTQCGFADYAGFFRAFKAEYGLAPREYVTQLRQRDAAAARG